MVHTLIDQDVLARLEVHMPVLPNLALFEHSGISDAAWPPKLVVQNYATVINNDLDGNLGRGEMLLHR
jgi:hypothetical protein